MSSHTWDETDGLVRDQVVELRAKIAFAFHGLLIPESVRSKLDHDFSDQPEVIEVHDLLDSTGWEFIDRDTILKAINQGIAVINLADRAILPYVMPFFMSLALTEAFDRDQDEMFVESILLRLTGFGNTGRMNLQVYSPPQKLVVEEFVRIASEVFGTPEESD